MSSIRSLITLTSGLKPGISYQEHILPASTGSTLDIESCNWMINTRVNYSLSETFCNLTTRRLLLSLLATTGYSYGLALKPLWAYIYTGSYNRPPGNWLTIGWSPFLQWPPGMTLLSLPGAISNAMGVTKSPYGVVWGMLWRWFIYCGAFILPLGFERQGWMSLENCPF